MMQYQRWFSMVWVLFFVVCFLFVWVLFFNVSSLGLFFIGGTVFYHLCPFLTTVSFISQTVDISNNAHWLFMTGTKLMGKKNSIDSLPQTGINNFVSTSKFADMTAKLITIITFHASQPELINSRDQEIFLCSTLPRSIT